MTRISGAYDHLLVANATNRSAAPSSPAQLQTGNGDLRDRLGAVFQRSFQENLQTVYDKELAGEFDDPQLRFKEQATLARIKEIAERNKQDESDRSTEKSTDNSALKPESLPHQSRPPAASIETPATSGANGVAGTAANGAHGAMGAPQAAAPAQSPAPSTSVDRKELLTTRKELYTLRTQQSEARLANISRKMRTSYPLANEIVSASSGAFDPTTFTPRTRREAEAFAQRMVVDSVEAAARLEVLKAQLEEARFDRATGNSSTSPEELAKLERDYHRQQAWVEKLASVVDRASSGAVRRAGSEAMSGASMRDQNDTPIEEFVADLLASGFTKDDILAVVGSLELAVEEDKTPGGSERLREISADMSNFYVDRLTQTRMEQRDEERRAELDAEARKKSLEAKERQKQHNFELYLARLAAQNANR